MLESIKITNNESEETTHYSIIDKFGKKQIQSLQEGIGLIRDIILENSQSIFIERYRFYDKELNIRKSQSKFYATFPRFFLEAAAIVPPVSIMSSINIA